MSKFYYSSAEAAKKALDELNHSIQGLSGNGVHYSFHPHEFSIEIHNGCLESDRAYSLLAKSGGKDSPSAARSFGNQTNSSEDQSQSADSSMSSSRAGDAAAAAGAAFTNSSGNFLARLETTFFGPGAPLEQWAWTVPLIKIGMVMTLIGMAFKYWYLSVPAAGLIGYYFYQKSQAKKSAQTADPVTVKKAS